MPAQRLTDHLTRLPYLAVVGADSDSVTNFVRHLGIAIEAVAGIRRGQSVRVAHMGPPFENPGRISAHVLASTSLTVDEENPIALYLDEVKMEYEAAERLPLALRNLRQYSIHPHVKPWCAKDGTTLWMRYSCVGFVIESYREAGIDLVEDDEDQLEPVNASTLDDAYPDLAPILQTPPRVREDLGIPGDGPWPVLLAGYVIHSLSRDPAAVRDRPYKPSLEDMTYP